MQMLKFLGRGSAFNVKEGNTSAYIKENNELLLIDCGESIFKKIMESNLLDGIEDIKVIITHLNSDHVGSLSSLIYYCYYIKKIKIDIFYPKEIDLIEMLKLQGNIYGKHYNILSYLNDIFPVYVEHIEDMDCYGYIIDLPSIQKKFYYSGDSNMIPPMILRDFINGDIDEIYQDTCLADYEENVHLSLRKLCELISLEHRNKVYCMHLDCDELIEKAKEQGFNVVELN